MVKKYGILHLLKKGLEVDDANFILFYQNPLASSSQQVKDNFESRIKLIFIHLSIILIIFKEKNKREFPQELFDNIFHEF